MLRTAGTSRSAGEANRVVAAAAKAVSPIKLDIRIEE
jgi:hypothetical protein